MPPERILITGMEDCPYMIIKSILGAFLGFILVCPVSVWLDEPVWLVCLGSCFFCVGP